jgi:hypothetical protein
MAGCLGFIFAAMSEFIVVRYLANSQKNKENAEYKCPSQPSNPRHAMAKSMQMSPYTEFCKAKVQQVEFFTFPIPIPTHSHTEKLARTLPT